MTKQAEETETEEGAEGSEPETTRDGQEATGSPLRRPQTWSREQAIEAGRKGGEATRRAWEERREEEALARALSSEGAALGLAQSVSRRTSAADGKVIAALEREAGKGDVPAARALLDWRRLDSAQGASPEALSLALLATQLPTALLATLRSTVLDLVRESQREAEEAKEPAQAANREGSVETDQSLPRPAPGATEPEATPPSGGTPIVLPARTPRSASQSAD